MNKHNSKISNEKHYSQNNIIYKVAIKEEDSNNEKILNWIVKTDNTIRFSALITKYSNSTTLWKCLAYKGYNEQSPYN